MCKTITYLLLIVLTAALACHGTFAVTVSDVDFTNVDTDSIQDEPISIVAIGDSPKKHGEISKLGVSPTRQSTENVEKDKESYAQQDVSIEITDPVDGIDSRVSELIYKKMAENGEQLAIPGEPFVAPEFDPDVLSLDDQPEKKENVGRNYDSQEYRFEIGDSIQLSVWGQPSMDQTISILPDGNIVCYLIGSVRAVGKTVNELNRVLTDRLGEYFHAPQVTVSPGQLAKGYEASVVLLGAVGYAGRYVLTPGARIMDVVGNAQGLTYDGVGEVLVDFERASINRQGEYIEVDFEALFKANDFRYNVKLKDGDVLNLVPRTTARAKKAGVVTVVGDVSDPGRVQIEEGDRLLDVLVQAGASEHQGDWGKSYIYRRGRYLSFNWRELLVTRDMAQNLLMEDNDIIYVPTRQDFVIVVGAVNEPGRYLIDYGDTVLDGIAKAEGLAFVGNSSELLGNLKASYVVRNNETLDVDFVKLFRMGDFTQNVETKDGDVIYIPERGEHQVFVFGEVQAPQAVDLIKDFTLLEIITKAGGLTKTGEYTGQVFVFRGGKLDEREVIERDLQKLLFQGDLDQNIDMEDGDIVYIPEIKISKWGRYTSFISTWMSFILEVNEFPDQFKNRSGN